MAIGDRAGFLPHCAVLVMVGMDRVRAAERKHWKVCVALCAQVVACHTFTVADELEMNATGTVTYWSHGILDATSQGRV
jgi:hypothetical protein